MIVVTSQEGRPTSKTLRDQNIFEQMMMYKFRIHDGLFLYDAIFRHIYAVSYVDELRSSKF